MANASNGLIPVIDFGILGLNRQNLPPLDEEPVQRLAHQVYTAFSTIGFVYLTNHGISLAEVSTGFYVVLLARFTIGKSSESRCFI